MGAVAAFVRFAEAINDYVGRTVAWLTLMTVLICAIVVALRLAVSHHFGWAQKLQSYMGGFIWLQELYIWSHALAFMLGAGYAALADRHVRVDIFYARASERRKAWLDLIGAFVFAFPWFLLLLWLATPYVADSWMLREGSQQVGGIPALYLLKTALLAFAILMLLQTLADCARCLLVIRGQGHLVPRMKVYGLGQ